MEETILFVLGIIFVLSLLIGVFQFLEERRPNRRWISGRIKGSALMKKALAREGELIRHDIL
jgi:hypothetical protein